MNEKHMLYVADKMMDAARNRDYKFIEEWSPSGPQMDYESIKEMARQYKRGIKDLLVLAPQNDPFYSGTPADIQKAEWFATLWQRFGYNTGVHLRRVHYQIVSHGNIESFSGDMYANTEKDWRDLCAAGKAARYLGLVSADAFVDRRNPPPHLFTNYTEEVCPRFDTTIPDWNILPEAVDIELPSLAVEGYEYSSNDQEYHVEIWIEKSTVDDIVLPIGKQYGVNVATSLGFQSITSVLQLLQRVKWSGKPGIVLFISDFDAAGDFMPRSVARQIEFWQKDYGVDIRLEPIVLTREQVVEYNLPTAPMKDTDKRKEGFMDRREVDGAVELDALEALHPGVLDQTIRAELDKYIDLSIKHALREAEQEAEEEAERFMFSITEKYVHEIVGIEEEVNEIYRSFYGRLQPHHERLNEIRRAIIAEIDSRQDDDLVLPARPAVDIEEDEREWLFDSSRDYIDQLNVYRNRESN